MRKQILFSLLMTLSVLTGSSQSNSDVGSPDVTSTDFIGTWEGKIRLHVDIRVVFNIRSDGNNGYISTTDSPDQGMYELKCDTTIVNKDSIRIEIRKLNAVYTGRLTASSKMSGIIMQGLPIMIEMTKNMGPLKEKYPQTPKPPFPYKSEDVEYDNADKSIHYGATLTIPQGKGPFPAAVLITGSGQSDRDETVMGHKVFAVLADALTRNGIAVLRVDDRGIGKSTGPVVTATSEDFAKDVNVSLNYLLTRTEVNKKKVGLIGHSEGGMIAPMVANQRSDIDFIVMLAGPGEPISKLMAEQNKAILLANGYSQKAIDSYIPYYNRMVSIMNSSLDSAAKAQAIVSNATNWKDTISKEVFNEFFKSENEFKSSITNFNRQVSSNWYRYFLAYDPTKNLEKLRCKVLALNGSKDIQVISTSNLASIKAALEKSKAKVKTVKEMPGLNHLFQTCVKCSLVEYGELEETFSPAALKEINDWLNKYVK